ncbi:DUF4870 domain-containing protein [Microbacterium dauci]|uniref:DUF4870 domain-containing protein n=1 Tax=Microbacterium dauci TaxID=3048008 RepID=A0ABT6ZA58_9MICO|nr:DUF4870 domain-containing protein [Microbacterium sp. LX3-4]MDJ1113048.1 DUF4870 domain-containing protein [Microbacterium sp. LX3-4]
MTDPNTPPPQGEPTPPPAAPTPPPAGHTPPPGYAAPPAGYQAPPAGYQAPPPGYAPAAAPLPPDQDKQWAMWAHIGGVLFLLPSLIIWLVFKDRGPRTNVEGKEALNWQITFTIVYVGAAIVLSILSFVLWFLGFLTGLVLFAIWVLNVVFSIQGGMKVNAGGSYRYPFNFRFIK